MQKSVVLPCPRKVLIFNSLSDEEISKVATMTRHKRFIKGQLLIQEGERSDTLFIINQGRVKLSKLNLQGKEQITALVKTMADGNTGG
ncbi:MULTISPECIES: cyclic nucleotide-binding domain-containing protein [Bacillus cereus group]|uniref:cyclic nucleotide-binding domain-containing protein n=1 Tax=Bacillus TaxID=1386 RepID=UPI0001A0CD65|nr:Transcriptional regulatory protein [Bacillus cereus Rock3-28]